MESKRVAGVIGRGSVLHGCVNIMSQFTDKSENNQVALPGSYLQHITTPRNTVDCEEGDKHISDHPFTKHNLLLDHESSATSSKISARFCAEKFLRVYLHTRTSSPAHSCLCCSGLLLSILQVSVCCSGIGRPSIRTDRTLVKRIHRSLHKNVIIFTLKMIKYQVRNVVKLYHFSFYATRTRKQATDVHEEIRKRLNVIIRCKSFCAQNYSGP